MMWVWRAADLVSALLILKKITGAAHKQSEGQWWGHRSNKRGKEEVRNARKQRVKKNKVGRKSGATSVRFNTGMRHMNGMHDMQGYAWYERERVQEGGEMAWKQVGLVWKERLGNSCITWIRKGEKRRNTRRGNTRRDNHNFTKGFELQGPGFSPQPTGHCSSQSLTLIKAISEAVPKGRAEYKAKYV